MHRCPWDFKPVAGEGHTCNIDCYSLWHAWVFDNQTLYVVGEGTNIVPITDGEERPLDMHEQPWYNQEADKEEQ